MDQMISNCCETSDSVWLNVFIRVNRHWKNSHVSKPNHSAKNQQATEDTHMENYQ